MNNLTELRTEIARRLDKHRTSSTRYGDEYKNPVRKGYDLALTEVLELIDDPDDQADDNPGPREPGSDPDHETDRARGAANGL
ncbi:hypothetical protein ACW2Q0_28380 [Nocardia sp. R16R-3T]